ncbi:MAG: type III-B CRISPR module RAMP protein Cmr1 [Saprospiraceae bacterium]|nr:type III-B CRISPR module RAMP protein Cmr1 [Saprospiraceae bacterium]
MSKIIFTCKTVTPLVMNGADGFNVELRPPGIKASLRFWWRALHGHLPIEQLRTQEAAIFGSTKGRSKVLIRTNTGIDESNKKRISLLPHKGGSEACSYIAGQDFKIRLDFDEKVISKEKLKYLFILACTLGGWGKRSRRGFGSVTVTEIDDVPFISPIDLDGILKCINTIVPNMFKIQNGAIIPTNISSNQYPYILEIKIGTSTKSLIQIGQATHDVKLIVDNSVNKRDYNNSIGAGSPRFASPVYVSILSNGVPVITTLKKESLVRTVLQNSLKSKILSP